MTTGRGMTTSTTLLRALDDFGDDEAWRTFLARYQPLILEEFRLRGLPPEHVADLYGDVMLRLVGALKGFLYDPTKRFRGWLRTLVKHEVWAFYRRDGRRPRPVSLGDRDVEDVGEALGDSLERLGWAIHAAERVRRRVDPIQWAAFWRTRVDDEPTADVARDLGLTRGEFYAARRKVDQELREEAARADLDSADPSEMEHIDELMSRLREIERAPRR